MRTSTLKHVGVLSVAKMSGAVYLVLGLLGGILVAGMSFLGAFAAAGAGGNEATFLGAVLGVGAIVFLPVMYGAMGFVTGALMAALYNLAAKALGGIELVIED